MDGYIDNIITIAWSEELCVRNLFETTKIHDCVGFIITSREITACLNKTAGVNWAHYWFHPNGSSSEKPLNDDKIKSEWLQRYWHNSEKTTLPNSWKSQKMMP